MKKNLDKIIIEDKNEPLPIDVLDIDEPVKKIETKSEKDMMVDLIKKKSKFEKMVVQQRRIRSNAIITK